MNTENFTNNNAGAKQKMNALIAFALIAGLLVGGVVGGALYALLFNDNDTPSVQSNSQAVSVSGGEGEAFELSNTEPGLYPVNVSAGIYLCDFTIRAREGVAPGYTGTVQLKSREQLQEENIEVGVGLPVATLTINFVSPQGLFNWYYHGYQEQTKATNITNKLFSDWDGVAYSGSFGLRSVGGSNYPVMDVNWDINNEILVASNTFFQWNLQCVPIQNTGETDSLRKNNCAYG